MNISRDYLAYKIEFLLVNFSCCGSEDVSVLVPSLSDITFVRYSNVLICIHYPFYMQTEVHMYCENDNVHVLHIL